MRCPYFATCLASPWIAPQHRLPSIDGLRDYGTGTWEGGPAIDCPDCKTREEQLRCKTCLGTGELSDPEHEHDTEGARHGRGGSGTLDKRSGDAFPAKVPVAVCSCGARRVDQQIGLEATPDEWCARLVDVFRELRRVLVKTGTLWIEIGTSYDNKDLVDQPAILAFGMQADGWILRSKNVWHKLNCLPESATDRPTVAHSFVLQFAKQRSYFCDMEAVREPAEWARWGDQTIVKEQPGKAGWIQPKTKEYLTQGRTTNGPRSTERRHETPGFEQRLVSADGQRNLRSVWTIPTQGFPDAHFATFPEALVERIIKMGTPEFVCRTCGKPREPIVEKRLALAEDGKTCTRCGKNHGKPREGSEHRAAQGVERFACLDTQTIGLSDCGHGSYRSGVILDCFLGSGTTALVARRLGRKCVGIELNADYCAMAAERLQQLSLLAEESA